MQSASFYQADHMTCVQYSGLKYSTVYNTAPSVLKICAADTTCQSRCLQPTCMCKAYLMGIRLYENGLLMEHGPSTPESELLCCVYELQEAREGKCEPVE